MPKSVHSLFFLLVLFSFSNNSFAGGPPVASFFSGDTTHCGNGFVQFINNSSASTHYLWFFGDGLTDTSYNPNHYYSKSGNYTVKLIVNNGLSSDSMVKNAYVKIFDIPVIMIQTRDTNLCLNSYDTLTAKGALSYSWMPGNLKTPVIIVNPTSQSQYRVVGTSAQGCKDSTTIQIHVRALPTVKIFPYLSYVCKGDTASLSASGADLYKWTPSADTNANVKVTPVTATTYTVTGLNIYGCSDTASAVVIVRALPTVIINPSRKSICFGSSDTLTGAGANTYTWLPGNVSGSQLIVTPGVTSTYTLIGQDINSCINTTSIVVKVDTLPVVNAGTSKTFCFGSGVTIGVPGKKGFAYKWVPGQDLSNDSLSSTRANPPFSTEYTLTVTNRSTHCSNVDSIYVTVDSLPTFRFLDTAICPNKPVVLGATPPKKGYLYQWTPATGISSATIGNPLATLTSPTNYKLTMKDSITGCAITDSVVIAFYTVDSTGIITGSPKVHAGDTDLYYVNGITGYSYHWTVSGALIIKGQGTDSITVVWSSSLLDSIKVWNITSCSDTVKLLVNQPTSILTPVSENVTLVLYPNPAKDNLTLKLSTADKDSYALHVFDITGRIIKTMQDAQSGLIYNINTSAWPSGVYFIRVSLTNGLQTTQKVSITR